MPAYHSPTADEVAIASKLAGYSMTTEEIHYQHQAAIGMIESLNFLQDYESKNSTKPRKLGEKPKENSNTHNQWAWRCKIKEQSSGLLAGINVGVKDCVAVAGVPMQAGSKAIMDYIPSFDSPCITALLNEGATIIGKTNCENMSFSTFSHTSCNGYVINPYDKNRTSGGSSSGSAVSVALKDVEMAIGTDTGGSVRIPSSFCGLVGMKTTAGLIPTKGLTPVAPSLDSIGPITRSVRTNALTLEVMTRSNIYLQRLIKGCKFSEDLNRGIKDMNIAVLKEGFEFDFADPEIIKVVKACIEKLSNLGANVSEISIAESNLGPSILVANMFKATHWLNDKLCPSGEKTMKSEIKEHFKDPNQMIHYAKSATLLRYYFNEEEADEITERAEEITDILKVKFVENLKMYDAICSPTVLIKAPYLPSKSLPLLEQFPPMIPLAFNTSLANITGHPAISINCGYTSENLPVGIMFTGNYFDEKTLYRIASAIENI